MINITKNSNVLSKWDKWSNNRTKYEKNHDNFSLVDICVFKEIINSYFLSTPKRQEPYIGQALMLK